MQFGGDDERATSAVAEVALRSNCIFCGIAEVALQTNALKTY